MVETPDLATRTGLPDPLKVLLEAYPRQGWTDDPGFDGLIRFWLDRHLMFRRLLEGMTEATAGLLDRQIEAERFGATLSRYGGMFVQGLHEHHMIEDTHYFPRLSRLDDRISAGFEILDRDHHAIDRHLADLVDGANAALGRLADREALQDRTGAFLEVLRLSNRLLDRHLEDEEDLIVPVILKYGFSET